MDAFISATCEGERCFCGKAAAKKVGEEIAIDDPMPRRHNLTAYVCAEHYAQIMGPLGARQVGLSSPRSSTVDEATVGWQPIETAPKDGTRLLLRHGDFVFVGSWREWMRDDYRWLSDGNNVPVRYPTHWQPLPEPPASLPSVAVQPMGDDVDKP